MKKFFVIFITFVGFCMFCKNCSSLFYFFFDIGVPNSPYQFGHLLGSTIRYLAGCAFGILIVLQCYKWFCDEEKNKSNIF